MIRVDKSDIRTALLTASRDGTRPHLACVHFEAEGRTVRLVATDGHRITKLERVYGEAEREACPFESANVPVWVLDAARNLWDTDQYRVGEMRIEPVRGLSPIQVTHRALSTQATGHAFYGLADDNATVREFSRVPPRLGFVGWLWDREKPNELTRYAPGGDLVRHKVEPYETRSPAIVAEDSAVTFPDWRTVVPTSYTHRARIDRKAFRKVERERDTDAVRLETHANGDLLAFTNPIDATPAKLLGVVGRRLSPEPFAIGVKASYMLDALTATGRDCDFACSDELSPMAFAVEGCTVVVMPVRL